MKETATDRFLTMGFYNSSDLRRHLEILPTEHQVAAFRKISAKNPFDTDILASAKALPPENIEEVYYETLDNLKMVDSKILFINDHATDADRAKEDFLLTISKRIKGHGRNKTKEGVVKTFLESLRRTKQLHEMIGSSVFPETKLEEKYLREKLSNQQQIGSIIKQLESRNLINNKTTAPRTTSRVGQSAHQPAV